MAGKESSFHARIRFLYFKARCYEERIDDDSSAERTFGAELSKLKRDLWEYRMKELNPDPPTPMPLRNDSGTRFVGVERGFIGRYFLLIALFAIAACTLGAGLIITRLVETYGKPLSAAERAELLRLLAELRGAEAGGT